MPPAGGVTSDQMKATKEPSFAESVCLPLLQGAQNADGGWGFQPGLSSRVEATCWALLALMEFQPCQNVRERLLQGRQFLYASQLHDGPWPASPGETAGCWVTALAAWVLLFEAEESRERVAAALEWLCEDWPKD